MTCVLVLGAGQIGSAIVEFLAATGDYRLTLGDHDARALEAPPCEGVACRQVDARDRASLVQAMHGQQVVVSALPYYLNPLIAEVARDQRVHYFDLTEDVATTRRVRELAEGADTAFMPQCGLAPGFISVLATDLASRFDTLDTIQLRVGALPQYPTNAWKYNLSWSTDGVINEYCNPCDAIHEGRRREVLALEGYEQFSLDGVTYEAFNTSGGLGTLCESMEGKVDSLDYKTVRYPGHCDITRVLVRDLKLGHRRELFLDILETAIPSATQDVVLIFASVSGRRRGRFMQESVARKIYSGAIDGKAWSAIQITTAAGVCAAVDLHREGRLPARGFIRQEDMRLADVLANRIGRHYAEPGPDLRETA